MLPTAGSASSSSPGLLPTPDAALALGGHLTRGGERSDELLLPGVALALLRTPTAQLRVNGGSQHPDKRKAGGHGPTLADEVEHLLPTPTVQEAHRSLWVDDRDRDGNPGQMLTSVVGALFPTPMTSDTQPEGPADRRRKSTQLRAVEHLLPTPVVNDMGEGKTVERWDEWTADLKGRHGNGNGHGPSLAIEAARLLPTPVVTDAKGTRNSTSGRQPDTEHHSGDTLGDVVFRGDIGDRLLPTPRATDGAKGGPNQRGSSGDVMLPAAVQPERWGAYSDAVARWEHVTGRPAPDATEPGKHGQPRLSAPFVEWMMGLPPGLVTAVPGVERNAQLKALGNGVVPQQAALAVAALLPQLPSHILAALREQPSDLASASAPADR